jgi:hypothetical protein
VSYKYIIENKYIKEIMDPFLPKNLRTEEKSALKQANQAWSKCVAENYIP